MIINVLKMDCEGCQFALARDVAVLDPFFFNRVDHFLVEVHISKTWIKDEIHVHYLGLLYHMHMLFNSGFQLSDATILLTGCAPADEAPGCPPGLRNVDYPCEMGKMCHNYICFRNHREGS